jgi:UDP-N-acetylmuramate dehydrogenase
VVSIRQSRLPDPAVEPNAGSFFKNPVLDPEQIGELSNRFSKLPVYGQANGRSKVPAAWLIDHCGWKGHRENGVGVHPEHALVLVNYGADNGDAVLQLAKKIADSVYCTFGIALEIEPRVYGQHNE